MYMFDEYAHVFVDMLLGRKRGKSVRKEASGKANIIQMDGK